MSMSDKDELSINETTLKKLFSFKQNDGFNDKSWDEWFDHLLAQSVKKTSQSEIENIMEKIHYGSLLYLVRHL